MLVALSCTDSEQRAHGVYTASTTASIVYTASTHTASTTQRVNTVHTVSTQYTQQYTSEYIQRLHRDNTEYE